MPDGLKHTKKAQTPTNLRLLLLVEHVAEAGEPVSAASLVKSLDLPKPTVHRLLSTAEEQGYLQRDVDGRSYGPGPRLRKLAANTLSSQRVRTERLAIMRALSEEVEETCNLAAPGRQGMVYLDRVETHWPLRIQLPRGTQVPFHCTASGKMYLSTMRPDRLARWMSSYELTPMTDHTLVDPEALMAELEETRKRGYSVDYQEFMDDMCAIAVAIRDDMGRLLTTLSVHAPVQRHSVDSLVAYLAPLQRAADKLGELID
ncbi:IclR family transcriptional regulator [Primorskyibacter sp. S187A]|uniref:IclR family transcriptional regulator n=1 Tax=Primorskyibacter sp. S187A TaxID=3415130 RepID=UPI003C7A9997